MKKTITSCCFLFGFTFPLWAALNYTESNLSVAFAYNASPTVFGELPPGIDDGLTNPYSIGFNFQFGSVVYTQFMVSSNGWMTFNTGCFGSDPANQLAGNATQTANNERPIIAPLWDDLDVDATGNVNYKLTGSSPNRILTVEWKKMRWKVSALGPVISFQVKLYENNNQIDFCYLQETSAVSSGTASIGLEGPSGTDYYSLTNTTAAPGVAHNAGEITTLNARPANNQVYRWTNNTAPLPVQLLSFYGENHGKENLVQWTTASETGNNFFTIERTDDGVHFSEVAHVAGGGTCSQSRNYSVTDEHPFFPITYYRLKETDFNGRNSFSALISVEAPLLTAPVSFYPNPSNGNLNFDFEAAAAGTAKLSVIDVNGKLVYAENIPVAEGTNHVERLLQLDAGVYSLQLSSGDALLTEQKLVVY